MAQSLSITSNQLFMHKLLIILSLLGALLTLTGCDVALKSSPRVLGHTIIEGHCYVTIYTAAKGMHASAATSHCPECRCLKVITDPAPAQRSPTHE